MVESARVYNITAIGKPRATQRDKWNPSPAVKRYRAWKDTVRSLNIQLNESGDHITFILPMPRSWSVKKRNEMDGKPHRQKPDLDNMHKAILDAIFTEDSHVWDARTTKVWGHVGRIVIGRA